VNQEFDGLIMDPVSVDHMPRTVCRVVAAVRRARQFPQWGSWLLPTLIPKLVDRLNDRRTHMGWSFDLLLLSKTLVVGWQPFPPLRCSSLTGAALARVGRFALSQPTVRRVGEALELLQWLFMNMLDLAATFLAVVEGLVERQIVGHSRVHLDKFQAMRDLQLFATSNKIARLLTPLRELPAMLAFCARNRNPLTFGR